MKIDAVITNTNKKESVYLMQENKIIGKIKSGQELVWNYDLPLTLYNARDAINALDPTL